MENLGILVYNRFGVKKKKKKEIKGRTPWSYRCISELKMGDM